MKFRSKIGHTLPKIVFSILAATAPFTPAMAQPTEQEDQGDWSIRLGIGAMSNPEFRGSDSNEIGPVPIVDIEYKERIFLTTQDGLGAWLVKNDEGLEFYLGGSIGYNFDNRDFGDRAEFVGLNTVDETIEARLLTGVEVGPVDIGLEVAQGISGGHDGLRATLDAEIFYPLSNQLIVSAGPFVTWGDSGYNRALYGVTPTEAAASAFEEYAPSSGLERVGAQFQTIYLFNQRVGLVAQVDYSRLVGEAADSPFIETKSQVDLLGGIFFNF